MSETIAGHENAETGIIDKGEDHEGQYRYYLVGADGHEFPLWPEEISHYRDLLDEFEATTMTTENDSSRSESVESQPIENGTDRVTEALPDRAMAMDELHEFLDGVDIQMRGRKPLPYFYEDTAFPTAFYLLSPPGFRAYAYNTERDEWRLVATVENGEETRSIDGMREVEHAVEKWRDETLGESSELGDGNA